MTKLKRHGRLALVLGVGVIGIVGATVLVAVGVPENVSDTKIGQVGDLVTPQGGDGILVAQVTTPGDKDKDKGKCPSKPCPKVRHPAN